MHSYRSTLVLVGGMMLALACGVIGCDNDSPTAPDTPPGPEGAMVTLTSSGATPPNTMVTNGQSVTFVNNDTVAHEIVSAPVPSYSDCPAINRVGRLEPGASVQTGALTVTRSCGFLDLMRTDDMKFQGTITVQ